MSGRWLWVRLPVPVWGVCRCWVGAVVGAWLVRLPVPGRCAGSCHVHLPGALLPLPRCSDPRFPGRCSSQWRCAVPAVWRPLPVHWRAGVSTCRQHPAQRLHPTCLGRISLHPRPASCPPLHAASPASATRAAASNISCPTTCLPAPSLPIVSRLPVTLLPRSCPRPQPTGASASCAGGPGLSVFSTALVNILFLHPAEESDGLVELVAVRGQAGAIARKGGCGKRAGAARRIVTGGGGLGRPPLPSRQFAACLPLYPTNTHRGRAAQVPGRHDLTAQARATPVQRRPARSPASQAHQQLPRAPWRCPEASLESASALGPPEGCPPCRPPNQWTMRSWEPQVRRAGRWPPTGPPPPMSGRRPRCRRRWVPPAGSPPLTCCPPRPINCRCRCPSRPGGVLVHGAVAVMPRGAAQRTQSHPGVQRAVARPRPAGAAPGGLGRERWACASTWEGCRASAAAPQVPLAPAALLSCPPAFLFLPCPQLSPLLRVSRLWGANSFVFSDGVTSWTGAGWMCRWDV